MTKLSAKEIIEQIQKQAKKPPAPPQGYDPNAAKKAPPPGTGGAAKPGAVKPGGGGTYAPVAAATVNAVREMQTAMQELSATIIQDSESGTMGAKPKDQIQPGADTPTKTSKKAFNDFIAEQYVGTLDEENKGVEWTKDQKVTTLPGKKTTQTDIYELDVVMDTLRRIGMEKSEFKPDGNWEWRTDNALKNMMGFAYALLQLEGDFGLPNNLYSYGHWKNFRDLLSGYKIENGAVKLSADEKKDKAEQITKHLKAITKLYTHFRQQVTARPEYRPLIEGKRPFEKYNQQGNNKDVLTPAEQQYSKSDVTKVDNVVYNAPRLPEKKINYIPLKALTSREAFLKHMMEYCGVPTEDQAIKIFNTVIKPKIESM
jgi:hypothetical protein